MLEFPPAYFIDITGDFPDPVFFFLMVIQDIETFIQRVMPACSDGLQLNAVKGRFIAIIGNIKLIRILNLLHDGRK